MGRSILEGPSTFKLPQGMVDPLNMVKVLNPYNCPFPPALSARKARVFLICRAIRLDKRRLLPNIEIYLTQLKAQIRRSLLDPTTQCCLETPIFQKTRISQMCRRSRHCEKMLESQGLVARSIINN